MTTGHCGMLSNENRPPEISDGKPAIVIVDNDDLKVDTMAGNATAAHQTNVIFVQPESYENKPDEELAASLMKKKQISAKLKPELCRANAGYPVQMQGGRVSTRSVLLVIPWTVTPRLTTVAVRLSSDVVVDRRCKAECGRAAIGLFSLGSVSKVNSFNSNSH